MTWILPRLWLFCALATAPAATQIIEFESNGLRFQTLTHRGVTVMFATMPSAVREYAIVQAAVANGGAGPCIVKPEDFTFVRADGTQVRGAEPRQIVSMMVEKGNRGDVVKLVTTYEASIYGMSRIRSTNGYEQRRQAAQAEVASTKLKAAAAASAIVFVQTRLNSGDSTDGAVFFPNEGKALGPGKLIVRNTAGLYEFPVE